MFLVGHDTDRGVIVPGLNCGFPNPCGEVVAVRVFHLNDYTCPGDRFDTGYVASVVAAIFGTPLDTVICESEG